GPHRLAHAAPGRAGVADGASVAVVAGGPVGCGRVRAGGGRGVAGPHHVTLVQRGADDARSPADAGLTVVARGAGVAVVADRAVRHRLGIRAGAGDRIAAAARVALIGGRAHDAGAAAHAGLAGVGGRARVAVAAGGAVGDGRV